MNYQLLQTTSILLLFSLLFCSCTNDIQKQDSEFQYGNNPKAGQFISVNGADIYFEIYGDEKNQPLILIHGNSGSIKAMTKQIEYFKEKFYVIVADNRTHGKSKGTDTLSYDIIASDYAGIMEAVNIDSAYVLGHSDGGIIGLLLAIHYPNKISKLISAVPNLVPGESAIESWELEFGKVYRALIDSMILKNDQSRNWQIEKLHMNLMRDEPDIKITDLTTIKCPVLVMTSDNDIIKTRHILGIYENITNAHLFIMPGATHFMIRDEHKLYNMMANRFLSNPFTRPTSKDALMELIGIKD